MNWLDERIMSAAAEVEEAGGTIRHFRRVVAERLGENPVTEWELGFWTRGLNRRLIELNSHWFRLGSGRQSSFSFFVRNEAGLLVGLRRESVTQAAAYAALVTHYGYARARVRFELEYLDVAVRDETGRTTLYTETKASDRVLDRLVKELSGSYAEGLPFLQLPEGVPAPDLYQKANHILRSRPRHFWAVSPNRRLAYAVDYTPFGFRLDPAPDIPAHVPEDLLALA